MNQTFSLPRFVQLNRWFWANNGRTYSLGLIALLTITTLMLARVLALKGYDASIARNNIPYFIILSITAVGFLSNHLVSVLHDQNSSLLYLMLPASRTEKFTIVVMYLLLLIAGYCVFYAAIEALVFQLANSRLPATGNLFKSELLSDPYERLGDLTFTIYSLLLMGVISLLSSLYFRQGVLVKSIVLAICLLFGLTVVYGYILDAFFPGLETHAGNFFLIGDLYVNPRGQYTGVTKLPRPSFIKYVFPWLMLGALWITARIRFNEIER